MKTEIYASKPGERIPNSRFPLLVHRNAIPEGGIEAVTTRFRTNGWSNNWHYPGVYTYAHFHSTTHECLGCARGWIDFKLSIGPEGWTQLRVNAGDVILMPAGISHEDVGHSDDNIMCGGYPDGRDWDNVQPEFLSQELYQQACKRIMMLPIPDRDPVTGETIDLWLDAPSSTEGWNDWRDGLDQTS